MKMEKMKMKIFEDLKAKKKKVSVVGLGYVGLPIALELAKKYSVIAFDINEERVQLMKEGQDPSNELHANAFQNTDIRFSSNAEDLADAHFHIVAVPTPVDKHKIPNLSALKSASKTVGKALKKGDYVIYESTVYPGCTEEDCLPILEEESGLTLGKDFKIGYSPERINPGDKKRTLTKITKVVAGSDQEALDEIALVYGSIITAGIHKTSSIKVAEAAKVIENTQRDLNIALMNELSMIFDRMEIDTQEVLTAAATKWNFLKFSPGLVGGHCIGVDPYYLTYKSENLGYSPKVILSGRSINDGMPEFIASKLVQLLIKKGKNPSECDVLVKGVTFKENVSDIRNSKVADLVKELQKFSVSVQLSDPFASPKEVLESYDLHLDNIIDQRYDALIVAVAHDTYKSLVIADFKQLLTSDAIVFDLKGLFKPENFNGISYWRL
jgi:UDP-N-acetyl-D-galactosamine dehydrogenase